MFAPSFFLLPLRADYARRSGVKRSLGWMPQIEWLLVDDAVFRVNYQEILPCRFRVGAKVTGIFSISNN